MLSDGLTKVLQDQSSLVEVQRRGYFEPSYSCLCEGVLWEPQKGLPPPKKTAAKDDASLYFLEAMQSTDVVLLGLAATGLDVERMFAEASSATSSSANGSN